MEKKKQKKPWSISAQKHWHLFSLKRCNLAAFKPQLALA